MSIVWLAWLIGAGATASEVVLVRDATELRAIVPKLKDGMTLRIAPGEYPGGNYVRGVSRLTVEAADPQNPPRFRGGQGGWHFSRCSGLTLRHLQVVGQTHNGINLDDGGQRTQPMQNVLIEHVEIREIGPQGNVDALKCSGVDDLTIRHCTMSGWGGQAIDLVGCHRVVISACRFEGQPGFSAHSGVQSKGGSEKVLVEGCEFVRAGERPLNVGGSTGKAFFRPPEAQYEAREITVRNNTITGSLCSCAFVGVDGAEFIGNTLLFPERWIFRILQENRTEGFVPCRKVRIAQNAIVYRRAALGEEINIGPGTAPETFQLEENWWFAEDRPTSRPRLPVAEKGGVYGRDPRQR